jgi:hypothetical protein
VARLTEEHLDRSLKSRLWVLGFAELLAAVGSAVSTGEDHVAQDVPDLLAAVGSAVSTGEDHVAQDVPDLLAAVGSAVSTGEDHVAQDVPDLPLVLIEDSATGFKLHVILLVQVSGKYAVLISMVDAEGETPKDRVVARLYRCSPSWMESRSRERCGDGWPELVPGADEDLRIAPEGVLQAKLGVGTVDTRDGPDLHGV